MKRIVNIVGSISGGCIQLFKKTLWAVCPVSLFSGGVGQNG